MNEPIGPEPPPKLPSQLYFYCGRCEKKCGPMEAGCEDDAGVEYCRQCTRKMYVAEELTADLAKRSDFMGPKLAYYNAMSVRRSSPKTKPKASPSDDPAELPLNASTPTITSGTV